MLKARRRRLSPPAVGARPDSVAGPGFPPGPARAGRDRAQRSGERATAAAFIRRRRLGPYLLLLPSLIGIGLVLLWPTIQVGILSFQNFGLGRSPARCPRSGWASATSRTC